MNRELIADRDGRLYLTVNRGNYTDARGAFNVRVRKDSIWRRWREPPNDQNDNSYDPFGLPGETANAPSRPRQGGISNNPIRDRRNRTLEKAIDVPGNQQRGIDTGIELRSGDQVTITATGSVTAGRRAGVVSPEGGRQSAASVFGASTYPVPTAGVGALIGYIVSSSGQSSQYFYIGPQSTLTTPVDGRLLPDGQRR